MRKAMDRINTSTPKKQHYLPQFILKNFKSGKKKRVHVFDKHRKQAYTSSVHEVACENGFYNIDIEGEYFTIEGKLASLESIASTIVNQIVRQETVASLSDQELSFFHLFCSVQLLRTQAQRERGKQIQDSILTWMASRDIQADQIENFKIFDDKELKRSHVHNINSLALDFSKHFRDKVMMLVKAPPRCTFLISDNPITMYNHMPRPGRGNLGLALDGIEVHMPLSPTLSVTFACPKMMDELAERVKSLQFIRSQGALPPFDSRDAEELVNTIESGRALELKPINVEFYNSLQVLQSSRFVYSSNDDFSLVEDMIRTNPECQYPPRIGTN